MDHQVQPQKRPSLIGQKKKKSDFLSQIRRSSNIVCSFPVKAFYWMQVVTQVSYGKNRSPWEKDKANPRSLT